MVYWKVCVKVEGYVNFFGVEFYYCFFFEFFYIFCFYIFWDDDVGFYFFFVFFGYGFCEGDDFEFCNVVVDEIFCEG